MGVAIFGGLGLLVQGKPTLAVPTARYAMFASLLYFCALCVIVGVIHNNAVNLDGLLILSPLFVSAIILCCIVLSNLIARLFK